MKSLSLLIVDFVDALPIVTDAINESDFIAIDGEFTGNLNLFQYCV